MLINRHRKSIQEKKLVFFVHIPKTAGSTVNVYLKQHLGKGYVHCEHFIQLEEKLRKRSTKANWMSGHVHFDMASARLSEIGVQDIRFYSCVRKPDAQVMSHLNWLMAIRHKSRLFFKRHPKILQDISNDVSAVGLGNKQQVIQILQKYHWLFLNTQWNTIFTPEYETTEKTVVKRLADFNYIGTETTIPDLILAITGKHITQPKVTNKSKYYFDTSIFEEEELKDFLATHNQKDFYLYHSVQKTFNGISNSLEYP
jgi:hypothetical protein